MANIDLLGRFLLLCVILFCGDPVSGQPIIDLQDRRELFVDSFLIDQIDQLELRMHHPHNEGPVFYFDQPWEGQFSAYCTIIKTEDKYQAYYRGMPAVGGDGSSREVSCYAESMDGIHWTKPKLGLYEINGSKENNVILANAAPVTHNFSPFLDTRPGVAPTQRYKALGGTQKSGLIAFTSADGIHWNRLQSEPVLTEGVFDSQNVAFWSASEQQYVCYFRTWTEEGYSGYRSVSRSTSTDFINWTTPVAMGFGNTPYEHLYTQQTSPYFRAPHIYLAIGARFMPGRQVISEEQAKQVNVNPKYYQDCSDAFLMSSRGGNQYERTFMESFIRPGIGLQNWVSRSNYPALNVVQTSPVELSIYVNENYAQSTAHLKRYSMRIDGFASLAAGYNRGTLITRPFRFAGNQLELNYSTSAAGGIRMEIQDEKSRVIPGFALEDCQEVIGNEISRVVQWGGRSDLRALAGKVIRLRIVMKDADLYSLRFFEED